MKLVSRLLVTLVLVCVVSAPAYSGEINCGVTSQAPCVQPAPTPPLEGPQTPEPTPEAPQEQEEVFWELLLTVVREALLML